jgi:multidrug efflux pump subunit AcrA (membrane-fusion protein)
VNDHHHDGCPHDHEGESCLFGVADSTDTSGDVEESSVEETQIVADAAVVIAEIEAETELAQIEASLEHHEIEAETELAQIEASLEHHEIEAAADELEEQVEELEELVELVIEEVEAPDDESADPEGAGDVLDEGGGEGEGDAILVTPPARIEAPGAPKKASRQSAFTRRHSRRG